MKKNFFLLLLIYSTITFSQGIKVDTIALSIPQLIRNELMQNSCSNEMNFKFSSHLGIGQFTNSNPGFPISNGIIIRNGIAKNTEGPYNGTNLSSQLTTSGDIDLQAISNANGQAGAITDVAFIQFDFTPLSSNFSFDFLFAANEYGEYQCSFSDVFAFLLTDLTTNVQTNLAVIPGTKTPVSVKNIRDDAYNSSCLSANANLFRNYNVNNPAASAINMRGETVLLKASSPVIPNRTYRIKLAIGDYNDSNFDSAVFIKGGSFTTTTDLGPDRTICQSENIILDSGLGPQFNFAWTRNGITIPGETQSKITVFQTGTYAIQATLPSSGCLITDEIVISDLLINTPKDLTVCNTGQATFQYDLTKNNLVTLGIVNPAEYTILYFDSLANANANTPQIPNADLTSYTSTGNQTIYIKLIHNLNNGTICDNLISFDLKTTAIISATTPPDLKFCNNASGIVNIDLTSQNPAILNGQNPAKYAITYFTSLLDAQNNTNKVQNPNTFQTTIAQSPQMIWVRMENALSQICFDLVSFTISVFPQPLVSDIPDIVECSSYILPVITDGNYFTGANGTGTPLFAGNVIDKTGTYYIFNGPIAPNGCTNENTFLAVFIDELSFKNTGCGEYIVPDTPAGDFFTGPSGTGVKIPQGTVLTTNQTIYYYAVINGAVCRDTPIIITVYSLPLVDKPIDVVACNTYTLPTLTNGNYFTGPGGTGTPLFAGNILALSKDVYVFTDDGSCTNENKFRVNIVDTTIYKPIISCGSYTLPPISVGNYYDQALGGGTLIPAGTIITSSRTVYYYTKTTLLPNCTDNLNYQITINQLPVVDKPINRFECESYTLPALISGNYFTATNGGGTSLNAGKVIYKTQTIYVFAKSGNGCSNEHSFLVEIRPLPPVDSFTDVFTCNDFVLPTLTNGTYYTSAAGPHGLGKIIPVGTVISTTQTIYIYNEWSDFTSCRNETVFTVDFNGVNVGNFPDLNECDSYTLPALKIGKYYSQPNGQGTVIPFGTVLNTSQTIYVYEKVGGRLTCSDEEDFILTISITPILTNHPDIEVCESYTLPPLLLGNYFSGANGTGTTYLAGQKISASQKMYVYISSPTNVKCFDEEQFEIIIHPLNNLTIPSGVICVDFITGTLISPFQLVSGLDPSIFDVEWYLNRTLMGTGPNYTATKEGTYDVIIIKKTPDSGSSCGYNPTSVIVGKSSQAIATLTVTGAFEDVIDIVVNITGGFGNYEYQLDNNSFQTDNVFHNSPSGEHTITIKDVKGNCGAITLIAYVLKYPKFFTPNGDGFNETWNIWDLANQPDDIINIYDRFGKFIKQINTGGQGWDGNYNGLPLPSTDYWFQVLYRSNTIPQEFKAHFSLKR